MTSESVKDRRTWSELHLAADKGHFDIIEDLLRRGDDVNARSGIFYRTPLILAARIPNIPTCEKLVSHPGCDVNSQDQYGVSALHEAAERGSVQVCQLLLDNRAEVDIPSNSGFTPLHVAARAGQLMVAKLLLEKGANPLALTHEEMTPSHLANEEGHTPVWRLLKDAADNSQNQGGARFVELADEVFPFKIGHLERAFKVSSYLGSGGFGLAFEALEIRTSQVCAIKRICLKSATNKSLREVRALMELRHVNIVTFYGCWREQPESKKQRDWDRTHFTELVCSRQTYHLDTTPYMYVQMELCRRETLEHYISKNRHEVNQHLFMSYVMQIASALKYIHGRGYIHRDLKPSNILFSLDGVVKIGDFGLAKEIAGYSVRNLTRHDQTTGVGTLWYMSPEQQIGDEYDYKTDVFSLGIIFYLGMTSFPSTFTSSQQERALMKLKLGLENVPPHFAEQNPESRQELLLLMCKEEPKKRPSAAYVEKLLAEWLNTSDLPTATQSSRQDAQSSTGNEQGATAKDDSTNEHSPAGSADNAGQSDTDNSKESITADTLLHANECHDSLGDYKEVLQKLEAVLGHDHLDTLRTKHSIAIELRSKGKLEESLQVYREVLDKREVVLGHDHPETLLTKHDIAFVLHNQRKYEEALRIYREVLDIRIRVLGHDHPHTLTTNHDIAFVLQRQEKYEEAMRVYTEVLDKKRKVFGHDHPDTLVTKHDMAFVLCKQGKYEESMQIYREVLYKRGNLLGRDHPDTLLTKYDIACLLQLQGKFEEALGTYREVLDKREIVLGSDHPDTLITKHDMAVTLEHQEKYEEALMVYREVLGRQEVVLGHGHPDTLQTKNNLDFVMAKSSTS